MRSIALVEASHERLRVPPWLRPMLAGGALGVMALWLPEVLGVGYEATDRVLGNQYDLPFVLILAIAKIGGTALCLGSRCGGGIFSPSLMIGAMVGGLDADLEQLKAAFRERHLPIFVVDEQERLIGSIAFEDLADAAFAPERTLPVTARDLVHRTPVALVPQDNLETALRLCEAHREEHMPVVDNGTDRRVIGEVRHGDLILAYNRALLEAHAAERGES